MRLPFRLERRWLYWGGGVLFAVIMLANQGMRAMLSSWWTLRGLRHQLADAQKEEGALAGRIAAAKGDDRALEKVARAELGYQRPGEVEYRFPPPKKQ